MHLLVTGASGLLGINLAWQAAAAAAGTEPVAPAWLPVRRVTGTVHHHGLRGAPFEVRQCNLSLPGEAERLLDAVQPDLVIHCAAMAILDRCEEEHGQAWQVNAELPGRLAAEAGRRGIRFVHFSTDAVFDGQAGEYSEEDEPNPISVYARSKLAGERLVLEANPAALVARVNFYGWSLTGRRSLAEWFFFNLQAGRSVPGFTDLVYCPMLTNDLVDLVFRIQAAGLKGLYHVFSSGSLSKYEFGVALAHACGLDERLITRSSSSQSPLKAPRSRCLTMRSDKLERDLGVTLPGPGDGLRRFYQLFRDGYPDRLHRLLDGAGSVP
jgi:dTDP-4-dehydrorhamnose reductase